ncbi:hypothetical protein BGZ75_007894 [Mortierella antarctica]|nr:hypothetical protein BGZ75_007894 [Mortierella antarctica]
MIAPGKRTAAPMEQTSYKKRSGDGEEEVQDDENAQSSAQELQDSQDASAGAGAAAAAQKGLQKVVCLRKGSNLLTDDENDYLSNATPPLYSPRNILGPDLPSSDPADPDFQEDWGLDLSTSRLYTWDYLHGPGRVDSGVESHWVCNGVEVGRDLLSFRDRIVDNNGGICDPYEMLAINFIFLVEAQYQTGGVQGQVEDQVWDGLCDAVKDPVPPLPDEVALEALRWTHRLAQNGSEEFLQLLEDSPPKNKALRSILTKMSDTAQLWNTHRRNEDTYLKSQLGPFLDTYFGKLRFTKRQEMKAALDSILKAQPGDEVCVVGILVKEPLVEFFTMRLHAEATYVMSRFAGAYVPSEAANAFPLVHLMEVFEHAKAIVEKTVEQVRRVKVHPSPNPKVPLSWLRPSFIKPRLRHIADGP